MTQASYPGKDSLMRLLAQHHAGQPWHGPSRAELLKDVTPEVAAWHPGAGAHSIWETVLHMRSWTDEVAARAAGKVPTGGEPVGGDWPAMPAPTAANWAAAVASLQAAHERLVATVRELPDARLGERVGATATDPAGTGIRVSTMIRSLAEHDVYHSGQLSLLKRLATAALGG